MNSFCLTALVVSLNSPLSTAYAAVLTDAYYDELADMARNECKLSAEKRLKQIDVDKLMSPQRYESSSFSLYASCMSIASQSLNQLDDHLFQSEAARNKFPICVERMKRGEYDKEIATTADRLVVCIEERGFM